MKTLGRQVLDIDYQAQSSFRDEMAACGAFQPDVILDDFSMVALLTAQVTETPRITVARTGVFPGGLPSNRNYRHSCESLGEGRFDFAGNYGNWESFFGIKPPNDFAQLSEANLSIVPGIPQIEVLPAGATDIQTYHFAGTLGIPDHEMAQLHAHGLASNPAIERFLEKHQGQRIALLTLGSVMASRGAMRSAVIDMLQAGIAVISTMTVDDLQPSLGDMFLYAQRVPMDAVCSRIDMMVHHCGSGTYQYAINHRLPSICIGSGFYDRDDVAKRLASLGVAIHLPFEHDDEAFIENFRQACTQASENGKWLEQARLALDGLKKENERVSRTFDMESILRSLWMTEEP
ncbi:glycosyltransferase [Dyella sp.]|uniref:glycosyltransferase n=1 Tax=Dyella sp. TaxID=1869338 RepID=UPI002ED178CE